MRIISCDTETTTFSKGNCFDDRNKLCMVGIADSARCSTWDVEYTEHPYGNAIRAIEAELLSATRVVFFNAKFDLNWLRKYGINYFDIKIWDCQLVHFILTNQKSRMPSLNEVAEYYGLGSKLDKIAEYWKAGVQTTEIPEDELSEYLAQDCNLTLQIYYKQLEELETKPHLKALINVSHVDTLVLADMEWNGLKYDFALSETKAESLSEQIFEIDKQLDYLFPIDGLNWNSNDHLSAVLYGGILKVPYREKTERVLKDGSIKYGERDAVKEIEMPRIVQPLEKTECAKDGYWKTSEDILNSLKAKGTAKKVIELVLKRSVLDKELNTYSLGLPKLYKEKHYTDEIIHGRLNQCVARTGRLSSSEPNMQNLSEAIRECFISRF
jgi:DNA polymerase-1